jgi:hypothetical protein
VIIILSAGIARAISAAGKSAWKLKAEFLDDRPPNIFLAEAIPHAMDAFLIR